MYRYAMALLSASQKAVFKHGLKYGLRADTGLQAFGHSVLSKGIQGHASLIQSSDQGVVADDQAPLTLALEYLEYSQLDEAQKVLEQAVLAGSQEIELHRLLLELYSKTADENRFTQMYMQLVSDSDFINAEWASAAVEFDTR